MPPLAFGGLQRKETRFHPPLYGQRNAVKMRIAASAV